MIMSELINSGYTNATQRINELENMTLQISQYNEHNTLNMENQIDPDNQFLNSINNNCRYYTNDQLNNISKDGQLSIIHINCRSLYANFTDIKDYLGQFTQPFTVIALSET